MTDAPLELGTTVRNDDLSVGVVLAVLLLALVLSGVVLLGVISGIRT